MSRCGFADTEAGGDVGQQAHGDEFGGADTETADSQREHGEPAHGGIGSDDRDGSGGTIKGGGHFGSDLRIVGLASSRATAASDAIVAQCFSSTASEGVSQLPPTHPTFGIFRY